MTVRGNGAIDNKLSDWVQAFRDGVNWSDGEPFTARDIVFSQQMVMNNESLNGSAGMREIIDSSYLPMGKPSLAHQDGYEAARSGLHQCERP